METTLVKADDMKPCVLERGTSREFESNRSLSDADRHAVLVQFGSSMECAWRPTF